MRYRILPVSNLFFVQTQKKGEWFYTRHTAYVEGSPLPYPGSRGFLTWMNAYDWVVLNKLHGNYARALLQVEAERAL